MPRRTHSKAELGVRLAIALGAFAMFAALQYADIYLGLNVPWWLYGLDLATVGTMVGRDILKDYAQNFAGGGPPGGGGG